MKDYLILAPILLPILLSVFTMILPFKKRMFMEIYVEVLVLITTACVFYLLINNPGQVDLLHFGRDLTLTLKIDGLGMVFSALISILWPLATLYSFEYMEHSKRQEQFFMFYTMTFGITVGIAFAGNILTMYFFYELLTLVTIPLVVHSYSREAILATRKYIYYSMGGAALGLMAVVFIINFGNGGSFVMGGVLTEQALDLGINLLLFIYVVSFLGFSVKAAMFPFYSWIPDAGVAPTPVTALLHAVAVVKAGAFACIRITYYCFGTDLLRGTWGQMIVMSLAMFTIVFGCSMAVRETHMKRRLAFSTVANLSYILFGVTLMTPEGLVGGLTHMVFHAVMKISAFFCVGAIMHQTHKNFVHETTGLGLKMPLVYTAFTISALGMMGVPGGCGFISKWYLAYAAFAHQSRMSKVGVLALLASALLTAIYMMTMVIRAFFPEKDFDASVLDGCKDPGWKMLLPLFCFSIAIVFFGFYSTSLVNFFQKISLGGI